MKLFLAMLTVFALLVAVQLALKTLIPRKTARPNDTADGEATLVLVEAERLGAAGAHWPEIISTLNARNDARIRDLLLEIRGSNMFVPGTGLELIAAGCRKALDVNDRASALDALRAAKLCMATATVEETPQGAMELREPTESDSV